MIIARTPECNCPKCGTLIDAASSMRGDEIPVEGDVSICNVCAARLVFNEDLTVRLMTQEEYYAMPMEAKNEMAKITIAIIAATLSSASFR
jgi:hypothetical protein